MKFIPENNTTYLVKRDCQIRGPHKVAFTYAVYFSGLYVVNTLSSHMEFTNHV